MNRVTHHGGKRYDDMTLTELADALGDLILDEDLDDEKLRDAAQGLLPCLYDTLLAEGHATPSAEPAS